MSEGAELTAEETKAISIYDKVAGLIVNDIDSYMLMSELLISVKKVVNKFEEETRPEIEQAHRLHKSLIAKRKKWSDKFEEAETLAKEKLKIFYAKETKSGQELPKIEGVSFIEKWAGEVVEPALIPREYLIPDIKKLDAITNALKGETHIPGWQVSATRTVAVKP